MDSIESILGGKKHTDEPAEMRIIREFISQEFNESCSVRIDQRSIAITVTNGALANLIQMRLHDIQDACNTDKKIYIRISAS